MQESRPGTGPARPGDRDVDVVNQVSGTLRGSTVQAGVVHGDVYLHHAASSPEIPIPRQLTAPPAFFTNRAGELQSLDRLLTSQPQPAGPIVVVLKGPGGVGKTALALRWLHTIADRFTDGQLYTDLGMLETGLAEGDTVGTAEVVGQFLRALGIAGAQVPSGVAERVGLFRSVTAGRSLAILLDNALSAAQVRMLLPASAACVVVVTSRATLRGLFSEGARVIEVDPLDHQAALELLERALGRERIAAEESSARDLVGLCSGWPIALCVTSAQLASRPRQSLTRAVADLTDERRRLEVLSADEEISVQSTFDASYRQLPPAAARLYRVMGLHPGPEFAVEVAAAATGTSRDQARSWAQVLIDASLLTEVAVDRYRFHDLLRVHAAGKAHAQEDPQAQVDAVGAMVEWYLYACRSAYRTLTPYRRQLPYQGLPHIAAMPVPVETTQSATALDWLEREHSTLLGAIRWTSQYRRGELTWQLADAMWPLYLLHKHYEQWWEVDRLARTAARIWGNPAAEISTLKRWARACMELGRITEAQTHLRQAVELAQAIGDRRRVASVHKATGVLLLDTDQPAEAVARFTDALATYRELGKQRSAGLTLINLGTALRRTGHAQDAVARLDEAVEVFAGLAHPDEYNSARVLIARGRALTQLGQWDRARADLTAALEAMTRLDSLFEQAQAHLGLGELAVTQNDRTTARAHAGEAVALLTATGSPKAAQAQALLDSVTPPLE